MKAGFPWLLHVFLLATASSAKYTQTFKDEDSFQGRATPEYPNGRRQLGEEVGHKPLRFAVEYSALEITEAQKQFLQNKLIPEATGFWSEILHVKPLENIVVPSSTCYQAAVPAAHRSSGVSNADYVLYVTAENTAHCGGTGGDTLAYAGKCFTEDGTDRPFIGFTNFCPGHLKTDPATFEYQITTALHELGHALGFASNNLAYFRYPNGTARVPRNTGGSPLQSTWNDGEGCSFQYPREVIKIKNDRGHLVSNVITESVVSAAREFYDCPTMEGVELENQDPKGSCARNPIGSHWEERLFGTEMMSAIAHKDLYLSPVTLAFFADTGWYRVHTDGTAAGSKRRPEWGYKKGCDFVNAACIDRSTNKAKTKPFCDTKGAQSCTADYMYRGVCNLQQYTSALPAAYQYFTDPTMGGSTDMYDYCPYTNGFSNGNCRDSANQPSRNFQGVTFSKNSRCVESSMWQVVDGYSLRAAPSTACYEMACKKADDGKWQLFIKVVRRKSVLSSSDSYAWVTCKTAGETHAVSGFDGSMTCPPPEQICSASTVDIVNATPTAPSAPLPIEETLTDVAGAASKAVLGLGGKYNSVARTKYQANWAIKILAETRDNEQVTMDDEYAAEIQHVFVSSLITPLVLVIVLLGYLIGRCCNARLRHAFPMNAKHSRICLLFMLVMSVTLTIGATGGTVHLHMGIDSVGAVGEKLDTFFNSSTIEAKTLLVYGNSFGGLASNAGCIDNQLMDELATKVAEFTEAGRQQVELLESFTKEVTRTREQFYNEELSEKYKWFIAAFVYLCQAFVLIACFVGIFAIVSRNYRMLHLTTAVGVAMLFLTAFSFSVSVALSVSLTDYCVETPENATLRLAQEEELITEDNLAMASYYITCRGSNPLDGTFAKATEAVLALENATHVLEKLMMPALVFGNFTNESAFIESLGVDGTKTFTLSDDSTLPAGIDPADYPHLAKYFPGTRRRLASSSNSSDWMSKYSNRTFCNNTVLDNMQEVCTSSRQSLKKLSELVSCTAVNDMFTTLTHQGLCTDVLGGLYTIWVSQLTAGFTLWLALMMTPCVRRRMKRSNWDYLKQETEKLTIRNKLKSGGAEGDKFVELVEDAMVAAKEKEAGQEATTAASMQCKTNKHYRAADHMVARLEEDDLDDDWGNMNGVSTYAKEALAEQKTL
jgi:leishmanolysin-like peptidase